MTKSRLSTLFYTGIAMLIVYELARVYLIMPLPGSQRMRSIDLAYSLHTWRWALRGVFALMIAAGLVAAWRGRAWRKVVVPTALALTSLAAYGSNVTMSADRIFLAPDSVIMKPESQNVVEMARLVVGIEIDGQARAYPVQFIGYHHQVRDVVAGKPVLVSFCTVCRTGRVFSPVVDGKVEDFRLVGMDHFNAMFEDATTGTWWRQANGEAVVGPLKGKRLDEIDSRQVSLYQWLQLHPASLIMQPDPALASRYSKSFDYETGRSKSALTGSDTASWNEKSWVVGITVDGASRAYDWNRLKREWVVNDTLGGKPIVLALAADTVSFFAFVRPDATPLSVRNDSLSSAISTWSFAGRSASAAPLEPLQASQEFWHSWRTFQPETSRY